MKHYFTLFYGFSFHHGILVWYQYGPSTICETHEAQIHHANIAHPDHTQSPGDTEPSCQSAMTAYTEPKSPGVSLRWQPHHLRLLTWAPDFTTIQTLTWQQTRHIIYCYNICTSFISYFIYPSQFNSIPTLVYSIVVNIKKNVLCLIVTFNTFCNNLMITKHCLNYFFFIKLCWLNWHSEKMMLNLYIKFLCSCLWTGMIKNDC